MDKSTERPERHLNAVGVYNPLVYKHAIFIEIGYHPDKKFSDNLYQHNPDYQEFKFNNLPKIRAEKYKHLIEDIGIWDYFLFHRGRNIEMHFRHEDDRFAVKAALAPESPQETRLISCTPDTSNRALRHMRAELKEMFRDTETGTKVKFLIDRKNKQIRVRTSNGPDFIQFMKDSAAMRGTVFPIPRPDGPEMDRKDAFSRATICAQRLARALTAPHHAFNAASLPPEMNFDVSYPRRSIPLPVTRRVPLNERIRSFTGNYYYVGPASDNGPS